MCCYSFNHSLVITFKRRLVDWCPNLHQQSLTSRSYCFFNILSKKYFSGTCSNNNCSRLKRLNDCAPKKSTIVNLNAITIVLIKQIIINKTLVKVLPITANLLNFTR